jgi:hypothetical protein
MDDTTNRPSYEPEPQETGGPQQPAARLTAVQRLWLAFTSPGEVFADIRIKPTWVLCLALMVLLGVGIQLVVMPHIDVEASIRAQMADRGAEVTDEQVEAIAEQQQKFAKFGPIIAIVVGPIAWAIMAAVFLVLLKIVGSEIDFVSTLSTALHAYWPPSLVATVLTGVLIQRAGQIPQTELQNVVKSHPGAFLSPDAPSWLEAVASTFSVFNIWTVVLLVIGFKVVGKLSTERAAVAALVPWAVWIAGKAGIATLIESIR